MSRMFYNSKSSSILPNIFEWNSNSIINTSRMFDNNLSLSSLLDILSKNIYEDKNKEELFKSYSLLFHLLYLSEFNDN